jgi:hypothetical protein
MAKKITIKDVPCYQCICLAICRNRDITQLEQDCPLIKKYYDNEPISIRNILAYLKWSLLVKVLKE